MSTTRKICAPELLQEKLEQFDRPLVLTNGCFDVIHVGHVAYLEAAKARGATLLVALNDDDSVRRLGKGSDRPINPLSDRLMLMAALAAVDLVTWFTEDTPLSLILKTRPDVLVKGGDWPVDSIVGAAEVIAWGGQAISIPIEHRRSTTALLDRIRENA